MEDEPQAAPDAAETADETANETADEIADLIKVVKDGVISFVHWTCVEAHLAVGWQVA